jgi:3-hydroxybutyryl-CoA dehydrogenase
MKIVVIADEKQKEELSKSVTAGSTIQWLTDLLELEGEAPDAIIDLLYDNSTERKNILRSLPSHIIINSVTETLQDTDRGFVRINGWSTFLSATIIEASIITVEKKDSIESIFKQFGKAIHWMPDIPGFATARVISMIINEAFFALAEKVSTKEEINNAMKLGTAYPYGPFQWAAIIGEEQICALLKNLASVQERYTPAPLLMQYCSQS